MIEQKKKAIGDHIYLVTQMVAFDALKVQTMLIKILGSGIVPIIDKIQKLQEKKDTGAVTKEFLSIIIPALANNFDDKAVNDLVAFLFRKNVFIEKNGHPEIVDFDTHFVGKPLDIWKVAGFILETNFAMGESIGSNSLTTGKEHQSKES